MTAPYTYLNRVAFIEYVIKCARETPNNSSFLITSEAKLTDGTPVTNGKVTAESRDGLSVFKVTFKSEVFAESPPGDWDEGVAWLEKVRMQIQESDT